MNNIIWYTAAILVTAPLAALCGEADVIDAEASCSPQSVCRFDVTVRHDDTGWDHYANKWGVLSSNGEVLGTRVLAHPHETEQPFTRSLSGVAIPEDATEVRIRAHDSVHSYGGEELTVNLPQRN